MIRFCHNIKAAHRKNGKNLNKNMDSNLELQDRNHNCSLMQSKQNTRK